MDANVKIAEIKSRIRNIVGIFPYTDFEIDILTIIYFAIASVDNDITDLLDEVLGRVFILFNHGEFNQILEMLKISPENLGGYNIPGFDEYGKDNNEFIFINLPECSDNKTLKMIINDLLESTIHEIKHAINGIINAHKQAENVGYLYSGLSTYSTKYSKINILLDECFNCFLTYIYCNMIGKLKEMNITDSGIKRILDAFTYKDEEAYSYGSTYLLERLFYDNDCFRIFYNATIYKDYEPLVQMLSEIFNGNYKDMQDVDSDIDTMFLAFEEYADRKIGVHFKKCSESYPKRILEIKASYSNI